MTAMRHSNQTLRIKRFSFFCQLESSRDRQSLQWPNQSFHRYGVYNRSIVLDGRGRGRPDGRGRGRLAIVIVDRCG